jgi:hypothetical protein
VALPRLHRLVLAALPHAGHHVAIIVLQSELSRRIFQEISIKYINTLPFCTNTPTVW